MKRLLGSLGVAAPANMPPQPLAFNPSVSDVRQIFSVVSLLAALGFQGCAAIPPAERDHAALEQPVDASHPGSPELGAATADSKAVADLVKRFTAAYRTGDAKLARSILVENYRRLQKSPSARTKDELRQLTQAASAVDLAAPALTHMLVLQRQGELSPTARASLDDVLAKISGATLNPRSAVACLRAQQRLLEELAGGDRPVSQELWLENLACDSEQNTPAPITLRDGLVLAAINAPASFVYLFNPPAGIPAGFSARIDPQPARPVIFDSDGQQLVLQTLPLRQVPSDARTQVYTITLTSGGRDRVYRVVLPVNLGMEVPVLPTFAPGAPVDIALLASGGPPDCTVLPQACSCLAAR